MLLQGVGGSRGVSLLGLSLRGWWDLSPSLAPFCFSWCSGVRTPWPCIPVMIHLLPHCNPEAVWPSDHGLKSLKLRPKQNCPSKCFFRISRSVESWPTEPLATVFLLLSCRMSRLRCVQHSNLFSRVRAGQIEENVTQNAVESYSYLIRWCPREMRVYAVIVDAGPARWCTG